MKATAKSKGPIYSITKLHNLYSELAAELKIEQVPLLITPADMKHLQGLVFEKGGTTKAAKHVGVHVSAYLTVCAGFVHVLRPKTVNKIRKYLDRHVR